MRRTPGDFLYDLFLVRQRIKDWVALPHVSEGQNPTILLSHNVVYTWRSNRMPIQEGMSLDQLD